MNASGARPAIVFVPSTSAASGVVTYVSALCSALPDLPCGCVVEPGSDLAAMLPAECTRLPARPGRAGMTAALRRLRGSAAFVQTHGPRALLAARVAGLRGPGLGHVFHETGDQQGLRGAIEWRLTRGIRRAANAPSTAEWVERRVGRPVEVLTPIVERSSPLSRDEARRELGIEPAEDLVIGVIGRLSPVKNAALAISAAAELAPRRVLVTFVGEGPERERLRTLGERLLVRVALPGHRSGAARLLPAFDVLAVPSPRETFGLSMAEATAAEVAVAAVDSPGARVVGSAIAAQLWPATAAGLANGIRRALEEPSALRARRAELVIAAFGPEASLARARAYFDAAAADAVRLRAV